MDNSHGGTLKNAPFPTATPVQPTTTAPIVGGAATQGSLHGGSVSVTSSPDPSTMRGGSASPLVNNDPIRSI